MQSLIVQNQQSVVGSQQPGLACVVLCIGQNSNAINLLFINNCLLPTGPIL